jgi:hypothetical protein
MEDEHVVVVAGHVEARVEQLAAVELAPVVCLLDHEDVERGTGGHGHGREAHVHSSVTAFKLLLGWSERTALARSDAAGTAS